MNDYDRNLIERLNRNLEKIKVKENKEINLMDIVTAAGVILMGLIVF